MLIAKGAKHEPDTFHEPLTIVLQLKNSQEGSNIYIGPKVRIVFCCQKG